MLTAIQDLVFQDCRNPGNVFSGAFFDQHVAVVAGYAKALAGPLGADPEIVELAAWLHDLAAVRDAATLPQHASAGAELACRLLAGFDYPQGRTEAVARAIASHSTPLQTGSPEEICLSNADALAQIARPAFWCYHAFHVRKLDFEEGRQWLLGIYESRWNALVGPARELLGNRYELARAMLSKEIL